MRSAASLLLVLVALPLAAQSNAERMANDRYSRSHDYDLLHERIEVGHFDWGEPGLDGRVTLSLRALRPAFDSVVLDAGALLDIRSVTTAGAAGTALRFRHERDTLVIYLARPLGFRDSTAITIGYHARIESGKGLTFIEADTAPPRRPRQVWSQGEDDNNHDWFPTYDFPNDKMTWEVIATVPKGYTAVSNGRLRLDRVNRDGTRTFSWSQERPSATYLVSIIVAPLAKLTDRWRGIPVDYYVYHADSARARRLFRRTPDMIEVYSRLTGVDYPWAKYAQTTVADFFGGMENVSATTLVDWIPEARDYVDRPWYSHILIPHELAHQWFGDYVTTANWANMWLNEGFAEFLPGQYWATRLGPRLGGEYYLDEYQQFLQIDQRRRMPLASLASNNIYPKGALVLEMLRKHLGDARFWAGVQRYLRDHAYGVATSDDLRQAMLLATGENLDWFWDQWVYQAGYPEFAVTATWDSTLGTVRLTVRQQQADTLPADSTGLRYTVPAVFRMPLTVRIGTATGDIVRTVDLTEREQVIAIGGVSTVPTMVVFDEGNTILKSLSFDQPTAWLATQLTRDDDLWNRWWLIGQLAARKNDAAAVAALARAATSADYFTTRVQAAEALGEIDSPAARDALLAALGDTSAQVRAAAAAGLGGFGEDPAVLAAVRGRWSGDSSDAVRAAAVGSLARLAPEAAPALLRQALRVPSYQDGISAAALTAILQLGDTSLVEDVAAAVPATANAGFVLAVFGGHGVGRAFDLLDRAFASPRSVVRRRVLQAYQFVVDPAVARPRLTALLGTTDEPERQQEIRETLDRLRQ